MPFSEERFPERVFEIDTSGLSGDEIHEKIDELAKDYNLDDAGDLYLEAVFMSRRGAAKREFIRYDSSVVFDFCWAYDHPEEVWYMQNLISMGSDVQNAIFNGRKEGNIRTFELKKIIFRGPLGIYDELVAKIRPEEEEESQTRYWFRRRRKGAFFPYKLSKKCIDSEEEEAKWLREELERVKNGTPTHNWVNDYQLLLFCTDEEIKELIQEVNEDKEGQKEEFAIKNLCFSTPCILWALKDQLTKEEYEDLWQSQTIFGTKYRTNELAKFLKKHQYNYKFYLEEGHSQTKYKNKEWTKSIKLQFVGEHWMKSGHIMVKYGDQRRKIRLNVFLHRCIKKGLLQHMSAFDIACIYNNFSYAAFGFANKSIEETFNELPENKIVPAPAAWSVSIAEKKFNPNKDFPRIVIFFDFEADTSGAYHKPFLVSACEVRLKEDGSWLSSSEIQSFWGISCAKDFMDWVFKRLAMKTPGKPEKRIRLYAYNARYDLTFILPYLCRTSVCMRANKFYSIEGNYINDLRKKPVKVEIWDAYLLFATSLRNAAKSTLQGGYLTPEQAKDIKKEMFPYNAYTYDYFNTHPTEWVNVEDMKEGFMEEDNEGNKHLNEAKYNEFIQTIYFFSGHKDCDVFEENGWDYDDNGNELNIALTKENPIMKYLYTWHGDIIDNTHVKLNPANYTRNVIENETMVFNYKKYAIFYCEQDVRCLTQIMLNMEDICMGRSTEGVSGQVPFKIHIWNHRTASSIGYDNLLMKAVYKEEDGEWKPRHDFYFLQNEGRALMQKSIRGGRVMTAQNKVWHFKAENGDYLQDCDACSLYPSTMAKILWLTDGIPFLLKGNFTHVEFQNYFTHPWASKEKSEEKTFNDGIVHIIFLLTKKNLDIPRLCVKDPKTKLNEWQNFDGQTPLDTWVNAKDLWDLIDHQNAVFYWDRAMGFTGERHYELQDCMRNLYAFRLPNKKLGVGNVAKLMMNSSYGKSTMKICDEEVHFIDANKFPEYFKANSYRIKSFEECNADSLELWPKYLVKIYKKDISAAFNMFGSNVLAGSKCLMQRFTSIVEDLAEEQGISPHIYYTDTDSNHILTSLVDKAREKYIEKYQEDPIGGNIGQFHNDFDCPRNFKVREEVKGADESYFLAKKVYCDHLLGSKGSDGYHLRLKGIPGNLIKPDDYKRLYNGEVLHFNLLAGGKVSFAYKGGQVVSRLEMHRDIKIKRKREEDTTEESDDEVPTRKLPRTDNPSLEY